MNNLRGRRPEKSPPRCTTAYYYEAIYQLLTEDAKLFGSMRTVVNAAILSFSRQSDESKMATIRDLHSLCEQAEAAKESQVTDDS